MQSFITFILLFVLFTIASKTTHGIEGDITNMISIGFVCLLIFKVWNR